MFEDGNYCWSGGVYCSGGFLDMGVDRIVDQVVNPKIYSLFLPKVEEVVQHCLKLDDNDKPMFVAPPRVQEPPQPLRFKDRHNLAPRAKVPAPRKTLTLLTVHLFCLLISQIGCPQNG